MPEIEKQNFKLLAEYREASDHSAVDHSVFQGIDEASQELKTQ